MCKYELQIIKILRWKLALNTKRAVRRGGHGDQRNSIIQSRGNPLINCLLIGATIVLSYIIFRSSCAGEITVVSEVLLYLSEVLTISQCSLINIYNLKSLQQGDFHVPCITYNILESYPIANCCWSKVLLLQVCLLDQNRFFRIQMFLILSALTYPKLVIYCK